MTLLIGTPLPGTYKARMAKGAIFVPVKITRPCACTIGDEVEHEWAEACDRYPRLRAFVDGVGERDPLQIWTHCYPISAADYAFMVDDHAWARAAAPHLPEANPRQAVNLAALPPVF